MKETLGFQAEVKQLLKLMIHSLYSNREIFLRELISNASDACDRLRFEAIGTPELLQAGDELSILVDYDKHGKTITVSDNGIGMSREEIVMNLGTIARSGTREFFDRLTGDQQKDAQLIGQFGVGFYSAFIVADRLTVISRRAGLSAAEAVRWESDGAGEFTLESAERAQRGTDVILHLKSEDTELLSSWQLRSILVKYSDHISTPVRMPKEHWDKDKSEYRRTGELETVNQASALWARPKSDITEQQYRDFYKHLSHDFGEALAWTHHRVEGRNEYIQLLYLPAQAPFDLWDRRHQRGLKLYVRRVFIMDDAEQLLPAYLRFVSGVVDSNDLPLNVSRELLQESRDVRMIREGSTKRILALLEDLAENRKDDYAKFWAEFGSVLKEGAGEDPANRERIARLLRFRSTSEAGVAAPAVSLAEYVARMVPAQKNIYFLTADSVEAAHGSPHLEIFRKKGVEVLLLTDRVDEWMIGFLTEFEGKPLQSVAKGELDLGALADAQETDERHKVETEFQPLLERVKQALGERVTRVRLSARLTESPACIVVDKDQVSSHLQRLLKAAGQSTPAPAPILELNADHPLVRRLRTDDSSLEQWANLLLEQAVLADGGQLDDPAAHVRRVNGLLLGRLKA
ncbi:MAG: molecular chaperone HtpG [Burkholderiaceae bacterium]|nr:molecular chaperone HtpG [Burkholderiaceae bacterium]